MKVELNIFTNAIISAPDTSFIEQTYASFIKKFGKINNTRVWYHPSPNLKSANEYRTNLKTLFGDVIIDTTSFSDGYVRSIKTSSSDYMFMLEHDWIFLNNINHSLDNIIQEMQQNKLWHLRFNKRKNIVKGEDTQIKLGNYINVPFCVTSFASNNPHIIHRELYIKNALNKIQIKGKSKGVEQNLRGVEAAIYGSLNYPNTVVHLDGRKNENISI